MLVIIIIFYLQFLCLFPIFNWSCLIVLCFSLRMFCFSSKHAQSALSRCQGSSKALVNTFLVCVNSGVSGWAALSNPVVLSASAGETQEEACWQEEHGNYFFTVDKSSHLHAMQPCTDEQSALQSCFQFGSSWVAAICKCFLLKKCSVATYYKAGVRFNLLELYYVILPDNNRFLAWWGERPGY